jgi:hypothetical protein
MKYCNLAKMMASRARKRRSDMTLQGSKCICTTVEVEPCWRGAVLVRYIMMQLDQFPFLECYRRAMRPSLELEETHNTLLTVACRFGQSSKITDLYK